ncbi:MAG: zinc ribbon domain-containing protein [Oscillospiraceae bacterium]|nr:zinc ribbon domain-containing protein [Oscillospiraceae bacterium]
MLLDETMGGIRSVFDSAAQKTAGAIENSRGYVERAKLRAALNDAYRRLGKAEYETAVNGVSSMDEINALMQKISELRRQMLDNERGMQRGGTMTCPTCGKLNSSEDAFCPACGTQLR